METRAKARAELAWGNGGGEESVGATALSGKPDNSIRNCDTKY